MKVQLWIGKEGELDGMSSDMLPDFRGNSGCTFSNRSTVGGGSWSHQGPYQDHALIACNVPTSTRTCIIAHKCWCKSLLRAAHVSANVIISAAVASEKGNLSAATLTTEGKE